MPYCTQLKPAAPEIQAPLFLQKMRMNGEKVMIYRIYVTAPEVM